MFRSTARVRWAGSISRSLVPKRRKGLANLRAAEALAAYQRSLEIYPRRFNSLLGAARAAREVGKESLACSLYLQLLEVASEDASRSAIEEARTFALRQAADRATDFRDRRATAAGDPSSLAGFPILAVFGLVWIAAGTLSYLVPEAVAPWIYVFPGPPATFRALTKSSANWRQRSVYEKLPAFPRDQPSTTKQSYRS